MNIVSTIKARKHTHTGQAGQGEWRKRLLNKLELKLLNQQVTEEQFRAEIVKKKLYYRER